MNRVVLFNPSLPDGGGFCAEECCFGPARTPPFNSPLGGLYSALYGSKDYIPTYAYSITEIQNPPHAIVMPLIIGYETYLSGLAKQLKFKFPSTRLIALCTPQGLAHTTSYANCWDDVVGENPIPTIVSMFDLVGDIKREYFPEIRYQALPQRPFIPWLLIASGCGSKCHYCTWGGKPMKWRDFRNTIHSIETMYQSGSWVVRCPLYLVCSEMNGFPKWMEEFVKAKEHSSIATIPIITDIRADWLTEKQVELLKRLQCVEVIAALESPNPNVLASIERKMDIQKFLDGYEMLREAGIKVNCPVLFGLHPEEDEKEYAEFCLKNKVVPNAGIAKAYPGTVLWKRVVEAGVWDEIREWPYPADPLRAPIGAEAAKVRLARFNKLVRQ